MRKDIVLVGMKTNEETGKAVSSLDGVVQEMVTALDSGMVRPSAVEVVNTTSGMMRDVSGLVRDASGLVRDLAGAVKDDATAEHYKKIVQMIQDLCRETERFSRYCKTFTDLARREESDDMIEDVLSLISDVYGMVRNTSHLSGTVLEGMESESENIHSLVQRVKCIKKKVTELEKCVELVIDPEETSIMLPDASGLVRDVSGVVRDISGLIRGNGWR
jgi:methyl-accepting chemotaxis protein